MHAGTIVGIITGIIVGGTVLYVMLYLFFKPLDDDTLAPYQLTPLWGKIGLLYMRLWELRWDSSKFTEAKWTKWLWVWFMPFAFMFYNQEATSLLGDRNTLAELKLQLWVAKGKPEWKAPEKEDYDE